MKKKDWMILGGVAGATLVTLLFFWLTLRTDTGERYSIWLFAGPFLGFIVLSGAIVAICKFVGNREKETFETWLSREGFSTQNLYVWEGDAMGTHQNASVCIDFDNKRFACNQLYRYVVPFERIANVQTEFSQLMFGSISETQRRVNLVISVREACDEFKYFYITMFDVVVDLAAFGEKEELTPTLVENYPEFRRMYELQQDVKKIIEINIADGVAMRQATEEEWDEQMPKDEMQSNDDLDYDPNDNADPNYTKPPHWNSRW